MPAKARNSAFDSVVYYYTAIFRKIQPFLMFSLDFRAFCICFIALRLHSRPFHFEVGG
jgi:hypothetical protein